MKRCLCVQVISHGIQVSCISQKQGKAEMDPVQVHNRYGHIVDSEDESVWNLPPNDSSFPMDESPSETSRSPKGIGGKGPNGSKAFPRSDSDNGSNHLMKLSRI